MVTYYTNAGIMEIRDSMPLLELQVITKEVKAKLGYVTFTELFKAMGYVKAYGNLWIKSEIK